MSTTRKTRKKATTVDDIDRAIIVALQADGRAPYTRLATAVGLSEAAVRQRVQRLVEQNVMQVVAVTNPTLHGHRLERQRREFRTLDVRVQQQLRSRLVVADENRARIEGDRGALGVAHER